MNWYWVQIQSSRLTMCWSKLPTWSKYKTWIPMCESQNSYAYRPSDHRPVSTAHRWIWKPQIIPIVIMVGTTVVPFFGCGGVIYQVKVKANLDGIQGKQVSSLAKDVFHKLVLSVFQFKEKAKQLQLWGTCILSDKKKQVSSLSKDASNWFVNYQIKDRTVRLQLCVGHLC